jgi:hypothetical protein
MAREKEERKRHTTDLGRESMRALSPWFVALTTKYYFLFEIKTGKRRAWAHDTGHGGGSTKSSATSSRTRAHLLFIVAVGRYA